MKKIIIILLVLSLMGCYTTSKWTGKSRVNEVEVMDYYDNGKECFLFTRDTTTAISYNIQVDKNFYIETLVGDTLKLIWFEYEDGYFGKWNLEEYRRIGSKYKTRFYFKEIMIK